MSKIYLKRNWLLVLSLAVIILDQLSKYLAVSLLEDTNSIQLVPRLIRLNLVRNSGAAFSLFSQSTTFLGILSFIVSITIFLWIWRNKSMTIFKGIGLSLLLAGSIGNGIDRWRLGYVNDFFELMPIDFPIFNIADIAINLAIFFLLLESLSKNKPH